MEVPKIVHLSELLSTYLNAEKTIINYESSRLIATGENYGSRILLLKIKIKNKDKEEILEAVAKLPPPNEFMQRMFNTQVTFKSEIDFYRTVVPTLKSFLSDRNLDGFLDCFPDFLGGRLNLSNSTKVDDDAVLLLENLKLKGFEMIDRNKGFDYSSTKVILQALAKYHAVPLALKLKQSEEFAKIRSFFTPYTVFDVDEAMHRFVVDKLCKMIEDIDGCEKTVPKVVEALTNTKQPLLKNSPEIIREPFATLIHTDVWVNNFMLKYQHGTPVSCKIVDFQLGEYGSPARDLLFFIFTSVHIPVIEQYFEDLVEEYHRALLGVLVKLECNVEAFSLEDFEKEFPVVAKEYEFCHCLMMLEPMYATQDSIKELDQMNEEDMMRVRIVPPKHKERAAFIAKEFVKRRWI